jgi:hypothetical protein
MAIISYLNIDGVRKIASEVKKRVSQMYNIKGSVRYINEDAVDTTFTSTGVWKNVAGTWTKISSFKVGDVFNVENAFETDTDFVEGAGNKVAGGTNIVVVNDGTDVAPVLKFDLLANAMSLDAYQLKVLQNPVTVFSNQTPTVYTAAADLPSTEAVASATITDLMVAVIGGTSSEAGDVYRASVTVNASDETQNDITWVKLGDQLTVEGMLSLLASTAPNTPITDAEIEAAFAD